MEFSTDIKEAFLRGGNAIELRRMAIKNGMKSLRIAAMERVAVGDTSIEEAVSMTLA
jgi:type IV pilus assembly protein PilB